MTNKPTNKVEEKCKHCGAVDCDDDSCFWKNVKEEHQKKRWDNDAKSVALLKKKGHSVQTLNAGISHYRVSGVDFWATTGKFYDTKTGKKGRGVFSLIKYLRTKNV